MAFGKWKALKYGTSGVPDSLLEDYPELVKTSSDADIAAELSGGGGINFWLADESTPTPFGEYPSSSPSTGSIIARAKYDLSSVASPGDQFGALAYDAGESTSENKAGVMDGNYVLFMPLEEDPSGSAPQMRDWVTDSLLGSAANMESGDLAAGTVANRLNFGGTNENVTVPDAAGLDISTSYTIEYWLTRGNSGDHFGKYNPTGNNRSLWALCSYNTFTFNMTTDGTLGTTTTVTASGTLGLGDTAFAAVVKDGSTLTAYLNTSAGTPATSVGNTYVGTADVSVGSGQAFGNCGIDELRISDAVRSDDWLTYAYQNDLNNSDTVTLGSEQTSGGGGAANSWYYNLIQAG